MAADGNWRSTVEWCKRPWVDNSNVVAAIDVFDSRKHQLNIKVLRYAAFITDLLGDKLHDHLRRYRQLFGYTQESLEYVMVPMAEQGKDPIGSMGDDTRLVTND